MIRISKKRCLLILLFTVMVGGACFGLFRFIEARKKFLIQEQRQKRFWLIGVKLQKKAFRHRDDLSNKQLERIRKSIMVLKGKVDDSNVVVINMIISASGDDEGPCLIIDWVDKCASVWQMNYVPASDDGNSLGRVLIAPENLPPPSLRHTGIFTLFVHIRPEPSLSTGDRPYTVNENETYYLLVGQDVFDNIMARKGQFVLLNQNGSILDRVPLSEVEYFKWWSVLSGHRNEREAYVLSP